MKQQEKSFVRERHDARMNARSIAAIETTLRDMQVMVAALDRYVAAEEARTHIIDVKHVAYPTAAMAARVRSDNLKKSVIELEAKLLVTTAEQDSALAKLAALEKSQDAAQSLLGFPMRDAGKPARSPASRATTNQRPPRHRHRIVARG